VCRGCIGTSALRFCAERFEAPTAPHSRCTMVGGNVGPKGKTKRWSPRRIHGRRKQTSDMDRSSVSNGKTWKRTQRGGSGEKGLGWDEKKRVARKPGCWGKKVCLRASFCGGCVVKEKKAGWFERGGFRPATPNQRKKETRPRRINRRQKGKGQNGRMKNEGSETATAVKSGEEPRGGHVSPPSGGVEAVARRGKPPRRSERRADRGAGGPGCAEKKRTGGEGA